MKTVASQHAKAMLQKALGTGTFSWIKSALEPKLPFRKGTGGLGVMLTDMSQRIVPYHSIDRDKPFIHSQWLEKDQASLI